MRLYHEGEQRWYRVPETDYSQDDCASASGTGEPVGVPELPNALMNPMAVNVLLATLDQKQSQWIAIHCCASPTGLNLMIHCSTCMWREAAFYVIELHRLGWQIVKGTLVPCLIPPRPIGCRMLGCNWPYLKAVLGPQVRRRRQPQPLRPLLCQQCAHLPDTLAHRSRGLCTYTRQHMQKRPC